MRTSSLRSRGSAVHINPYGLLCLGIVLFASVGYIAWTFVPEFKQSAVALEERVAEAAVGVGPAPNAAAASASRQLPRSNAGPDNLRVLEDRSKRLRSDLKDAEQRARDAEQRARDAEQRAREAEQRAHDAERLRSLSNNAPLVSAYPRWAPKVFLPTLGDD